MSARRLCSLPGGVVVSPSSSLGLAKFNRAAMQGSVIPPLTQFLCSRCPSLPEILLIGFFCSVR